VDRIKASVFVLMPFDHPLLGSSYEKGIEQACTEAEACCTRVDREVIFGKITEEIYNQIDRADILVADVTGSNPNVFYEIGFAHGIGKNVIFIKHSEDKDNFPFDTQDFQHIIYNNPDRLREELVRRISRFSENPKLNAWNSDFHKRRQQRYIPNLYEGFTEASISMENFIKPLLSKKGAFNIKVMGMALHKSWPLISSLLEDMYLGKWESPKLTIDLAFIRMEWIKEKDGLIHQDWIDRLKIIEDQIDQFIRKSEGQVSFNIYRFHHMPYLHGMLIDDQHLFLGHCSWDRHNKFTVGSNIYEEYNGDVLAGDRMIEQFNRWFTYCVNEHEYYSSKKL